MDNNYVDAVIQLPADLFFGTTIATCILVLKKSKVDAKVLFIDAGAEFVRQGNKNKLAEANIARVLAAYASREPKAHFAALVSDDDLAAGGYNLSAPATSN